ncbi:hypothetical protein HYN56_16440 [Flavobacterium crocinum]|uniref:Uncharacterized protein n=1 Tax=Flavobacterium crocinum TaxID=2183896 RepID=A0A2S1YNT1_9FLAO|nr:hypothetical protein [Flavobacterium crocinum]AWK05739.1 hypothetical protein HYN56_16440 [Flavobacterium crocinum]
MSTFNTRLTVFFFVLITFYSCKKDEKTIHKENEHQNTKIATDDPIVTLFTFSNENNTEVIKISANGAGDEDKFSLGADKITIIVSKYKNLKIVQQDTLLISEFNYINVDPHFLRKKIQGTDYFLFALKESPMGNGDPSSYLSYIMINTNNLNFYKLGYIGEYTLRSGDFIDGDFTKDKILESNTKVYTELYQFASKSKWIYKPAEKEKDINYYKNFEQKWYKDNTHEDGETSASFTITSTYYTEDLFKFNGLYDDDQVIENADFKIVSYFRHNIIAYDKNKSLYFPVIVESCAHGCGKDIKFVSENEIEIVYEMNTQKADTLDLHNIKFTNPQ